MSNEKWGGHEDARRVFPMPFPLMVVATKYDTFLGNEPEKLKWMCRALRYFSHVNNADLVFSSTKDRGILDVKTLVN